MRPALETGHLFSTQRNNMKTIAIFLLLCASAVAGPMDLPNYIAGPIPGNDNAALVTSLVDRNVELVGKFEITEDDNLFITVDTGVAIPDTLIYLTPETFTVDGTDWDYLAAKYGNQFLVFERTGDLTFFEIERFGLSHVTLYRGTPEPSSAALLGLGSLVLLAFRRKR